MTTIDDLASVQLDMIDGSTRTMSEFLDKVVLVVNVASRCGFSPQYGRLETLHSDLSSRGFTVLGLPSNQFQQELDSEEDIKAYCSITWGVTFPMTKKVELEGPSQHPLYRKLTQSSFSDGSSGPVRWNFEKFLIVPSGAIFRIGHETKPDSEAVLELIYAHLPRA
jgi:glutathione peroxidase